MPLVIVSLSSSINTALWGSRRFQSIHIMLNRSSIHLYILSFSIHCLSTFPSILPPSFVSSVQLCLCHQLLPFLPPSFYFIIHTLIHQQIQSSTHLFTHFFTHISPPIHLPFPLLIHRSMSKPFRLPYLPCTALT